jgi:hypothetical protein
MKGKKKQVEIKELLAKLQGWENENTPPLSEELKELRHHVMHIHFRMEVWLEDMIADYLMVPFQRLKPTIDDGLNFWVHMRSVVEGMDFAKKLGVLESTKRIHPNTKRVLHKVNRYRVIFNHPSSYLNEIEELKNPDKYNEALKTLVKACESFDKMFSFKRALKELENELEKNK